MNAPTLIVGIGGTGSKVVLRVAEKVTVQERNKIGFAVFDTDVNELKDIKKKDASIYTIQTSTSSTVGEYLNRDVHSRDEWFPVNTILNGKTLTEGAGQVRAISRLAFETAMRSGQLAPLHKAITDLFKLEGNEYQQAVRVIIVSSLAGGTGSGLILPVSLYIKNYLTTHFQKSANIVRGFFLLPEIFYSVIPGQAEQNNLKSNAYATLRELDAFLMKGDNTLPAKYQDTVKMEFPNVGSEGYEEYKVRPFDFCFLFDAQNANGAKLNSFEEYLDHAANCIYAQSIGPMNTRSNSSEDNTIRKLCEEKGRNRYAGAGTSMLIYPIEDVKRYLALNWANECISKQWLTYDNMYKKRLEQNAKDRRAGIRVADLKPDECYVSCVNSEAGKNDPLSMAIIDACTIYDEHGDSEGNVWENYIEALHEYVIGEVNSELQADINGLADTAKKRINDISGESDNDGIASSCKDAYYALKDYLKRIKDKKDNNARTIAFSIFRSEDANVTGDRQNYRLETYMRKTDGSFMHPNAVRYMLYKVLESLKSELDNTRSTKDSEEKFFDNFERKNFDDPASEGSVESVEDIKETKKRGMVDRWKHNLGDYEDLVKQYRTYLKNADAYKADVVYEQVLKEGIDYVQTLCEAFESFFASFDSKIAGINKEIRKIEGKHKNMAGTAARYVCASPKYLAAQLKAAPYRGGVIEIDSKLAETIYLKVREVALLDSRSEKKDYFGDIFNFDVIGYFTDKLMATYGGDINIDIISAIEKEAQLEAGLTEDEEIRQYVIDVFNQAKVLAAPFIEKPMGDDKQPIYSCTYNTSLVEDEDSPRAILVREELKDFGGKPDDDISKYMILFYKSYYGLRANELSKFAPPESGMTKDRPSGEYYKAYYELVSKIYPIAHESKVVTPHIDKWWHNVSKMPDLDEGSQKMQEDKVNAALFWGFIGGYIEVFDKKYKLMVDLLKMKGVPDNLVVSNGTPCDRLYEVHDALSIYPELVDNILEQSEKSVVHEIDENRDFKDSKLIKMLSKFRVYDYPLTEKDNARSIFDLAYLMKRSMLAGVYDEDKVLGILAVSIEEIKKYIARFFRDKEYRIQTRNIILDQFERFLTDISVESWSQQIYSDILFRRSCLVIADQLESLGFEDDADYVRTRAEELRRRD